nr:transposase, MuDR, MULE transposase domain protein [Tanacetum cinerariifolium]
MLAVRLKAVSEEKYYITYLNDVHTCSKTQTYPNHRNANKKVIGHLLTPKLQDRSRVLRGKDIQKDILSKYKVHISYQQALKGKHYGIQQVRGSPYEAYEMLPYYCYNLEKKNEGMVTRIKTDDNSVFEMLFIAIGASIRTFLNYLRPVLMINAAHLKGLYKGTNLVAVAMDGITRLCQLRLVYAKEKQLDAHEKLCRAGPQRWPRAHCPLVRYNYMTSNSVASVNACSVIYRKEPVLKLAEMYRAMVQEWYYKRRQLAANMTYEITDWAANKMAKKRMKSATWVVNGVNAYQYEVSD